MLRDQLATQLKEAMKAKNAERLSTVRLIQAAVKDRDIANRGTGKEQASDDEILQILAKMVKQRDESAKIYEENSRPELAAKERAEIIVIQDFMPKQLSDSEVRANVSAIIAETGAAGAKDMGKVMAALKAKHAASLDMAKAGPAVKAALGG
jgi:uncharacterized protein YqeY